MSAPGLSRVSALGTPEGAPPAVLFETPDLRLVEEPFLPVWRLRAGRAAAPQWPGVELPGRMNTFTGDERRSCAQVEPRAWTVFGGDILPAPAPAAALPLVVDVSDRHACLRLSGAGAARLLAAGTSLELAPGAAAHTLFAEEFVVFVQRFAGDGGWRIAVDAPLAPALGRWLVDAARLLRERVVPADAGAGAAASGAPAPRRSAAPGSP